jgi:hypothetical protein
MARQDWPQMSECLIEYGMSLFTAGRSKRDFAETLNWVTAKFHWLKGMLGGCWKIIAAWEMIEPVRQHPPIPLSVLQALVAVALAWNWRRMAVTLVFGFALLRPIEFMSLCRDNIFLPADHDSGSVIFVTVDQPKTRNRGARHQYVRLEDGAS